MSRFHNRNFELLEPYEGKLSRTVLRGVGSSNAPDLLDHCIEEAKRIAREARERLGTLCPALVQYAIEA